MIATAIALMRTHWKLAAFATLALFAAYQTLTKRTAIVERNAANERYASLEIRVREISAHAVEIATKAKATQEQRNKDLNNAADRQASSAVIVYRDRVMRLPAAPDSDGGCSANLPGADFSGSADRAGGDTVLLARADALICAANQGRLEAARDWAMQMQER